MVEATDRAVEEWEIVITPFPIFGDLLYSLYFKHKEHSFKLLHETYKTHQEAQQEQRRISHDLVALRNDRFKEKYQIGHDLKGSLL